MSETTQTIVDWALYWADPDPYRMQAGDFTTIFTEAGCELLPTDSQIKGALKQGTGINMGSGKTKTKHWCGILATSILYRAGLGVRWSLMKGKMVIENSGHVALRPAGAVGEIKIGDVAVIPKNEHHFIVYYVDHKSGVLMSVDGNQVTKDDSGQTMGQVIMTRIRSVHPKDPNERIKYFYSILV